MGNEKWKGGIGTWIGERGMENEKWTMEKGQWMGNGQ